MASAKDTATFFNKGTHIQYENVLRLYPQAVRLKAKERRPNKCEEVINLDNWYQEELPKRIRDREKDKHMTHEELVQTMKWKQLRGKYYPQLSFLIKVNTPKAVITETRKAFRKLPNLEQAITALSNLKGVGTTMASALLAAACPERAPFMADECLLAIPDIEGIDYTTKEYLKFVNHISAVADRLNNEAKVCSAACAEQIAAAALVAPPPTSPLEELMWKLNQPTSPPRPPPNLFRHWSPHNVELALWTHYVLSDLNPQLLAGVGEPPVVNGISISPEEEPHQNGDSVDATTSEESNPPLDTLNGKTTAADGGLVGTASPPAASVLDEDTSTSFADHTSCPPPFDEEEDDIGEETNEDSLVSDSTTSDSAQNNKRKLTNMIADEDGGETTTSSMEDPQGQQPQATHHPDGGVIVSPQTKKVKSAATEGSEDNILVGDSGDGEK